MTFGLSSEELLWHQTNLQLKGIYVPGLDRPATQAGRVMWREFRLRFAEAGQSVERASLKLAARPRGATPYAFIDGRLMHDEANLKFDGVDVSRVALPETEAAWHLKGYTFPYRGSSNPYYELRINPRITGFCPGRCTFCHRAHSHVLKPERRRVERSDGILRRVIESEGPDVFGMIDRVMFIAELFGREDRFLEAVTDTERALDDVGYPADREFNCCAHDVRSADGHRQLRSIVRPDRYSFTLEFFTRREQLMGFYKGLPLDSVREVLVNARAAGFAEIQLNYMAGIDSLDECKEGFNDLIREGLVDSVGLSTFTAFSDAQLSIRHSDAGEPDFYRAVVAILSSLDLRVYRHSSYDMRLPFAAALPPSRL